MADKDIFGRKKLKKKGSDTSWGSRSEELSAVPNALRDAETKLNESDYMDRVVNQILEDHGRYDKEPLNPAQMRNRQKEISKYLESDKHTDNTVKRYAWQNYLYKQQKDMSTEEEAAQKEADLKQADDDIPAWEKEKDETLALKMKEDYGRDLNRTREDKDSAIREKKYQARISGEKPAEPPRRKLTEEQERETIYKAIMASYTFGQSESVPKKSSISTKGKETERRNKISAHIAQNPDFSYGEAARYAKEWSNYIESLSKKKEKPTNPSPEAKEKESAASTEKQLAVAEKNHGRLKKLGTTEATKEFGSYPKYIDALRETRLKLNDAKADHDDFVSGETKEPEKEKLKPAPKAKEPAQPTGRETITPSEDTSLGKNDAGEKLYKRPDGSQYRMRTDSKGRLHGYPDFGGDLSVAPKQAAKVEPAAETKAQGGRLPLNTLADELHALGAGENTWISEHSPGGVHGSATHDLPFRQDLEQLHGKRFTDDEWSTLQQAHTDGQAIDFDKKPEKVEEKPATTSKPVDAVEPKRGDRFTDKDGKLWEIWKTRHGWVDAHPVVDGKPVVNNASGDHWAVSDIAKMRDPDHRTDFNPVKPTSETEGKKPEEKVEEKPATTKEPWEINEREYGEQERQISLTSLRENLRKAKSGEEEPNVFSNGAKSKAALIRTREKDIKDAESTAPERYAGDHLRFINKAIREGKDVPQANLDRYDIKTEEPAKKAPTTPPKEPNKDKGWEQIKKGIEKLHAEMRNRDPADYKEPTKEEEQKAYQDAAKDKMASKAKRLKEAMENHEKLKKLGPVEGEYKFGSYAKYTKELNNSREEANDAKADHDSTERLYYPRKAKEPEKKSEPVEEKPVSAQAAYDKAKKKLEEAEENHEKLKKLGEETQKAYEDAVKDERQKANQDAAKDKPGKVADTPPKEPVAEVKEMKEKPKQQEFDLTPPKAEKEKPVEAKKEDLPKEKERLGLNLKDAKELYAIQEGLRELMDRARGSESGSPERKAVEEKEEEKSDKMVKLGFPKPPKPQKRGGKGVLKGRIVPIPEHDVIQEDGSLVPYQTRAKVQEGVTTASRAAEKKAAREAPVTEVKPKELPVVPSPKTPAANLKTGDGGTPTTNPVTGKGADLPGDQEAGGGVPLPEKAPKPRRQRPAPTVDQENAIYEASASADNSLQALNNLPKGDPSIRKEFWDRYVDHRQILSKLLEEVGYDRLGKTGDTKVLKPDHGLPEDLVQGAGVYRKQKQDPKADQVFPATAAPVPAAPAPPAPQRVEPTVTPPRIESMVGSTSPLPQTQPQPQTQAPAPASAAPVPQPQPQPAPAPAPTPQPQVQPAPAGTAPVAPAPWFPLGPGKGQVTWPPQNGQAVPAPVPQIQAQPAPAPIPTAPPSGRGSQAAIQAAAASGAKPIDPGRFAATTQTVQAPPAVMNPSRITVKPTASPEPKKKIDPYAQNVETTLGPAPGPFASKTQLASPPPQKLKPAVQTSEGKHAPYTPKSEIIEEAPKQEGFDDFDVTPTSKAQAKVPSKTGVEFASPAPEKQKPAIDAGLKPDVKQGIPVPPPKKKSLIAKVAGKIGLGGKPPVPPPTAYPVPENKPIIGAQGRGDSPLVIPKTGQPKPAQQQPGTQPQQPQQPKSQQQPGTQKPNPQQQPVPGKPQQGVPLLPMTRYEKVKRALASASQSVGQVATSASQSIGRVATHGITKAALAHLGMAAIHGINYPKAVQNMGPREKRKWNPGWHGFTTPVGKPEDEAKTAEQQKAAPEPKETAEPKTSGKWERRDR